MRIHDSIHGYIDIDPVASAIIDTHVFQRLRHIHQTGVLYFVFPTATHTRFEHSIGTYHLAKQMISEIARKQPTLGVSDDLIQLVAIAGLCHDLGHLLFSHLFDEFLEHINTGLDTKNSIHENRSIFLLRYAVQTYQIRLSSAQLRVIGDLINPSQSEYHNWRPEYQVGQWIFQIVANPVNSIDVDKFDYLTRDTRATGLKLGFDYTRMIMDARVIDDEICYSSQCRDDIYHMFFIRYRLHRQIYNHKAVKALEILMVDLLFELEKVFKISEYITDAEKMIQLVDYFVFSFPSLNSPINHIIRKIQTRKLPKLVYQNVSLEETTGHLSFAPESSYRVVQFKVGYVGGKTNPLTKINFYNFKDGTKIENKGSDFSLLINQNHQEYFFRVYCVDEDD
jgi:HD superfamily phosphohydrolase